MNNCNVQRVLIYRLGSLGDTIVALPCFHLIARIFPKAERYLLTNFHVNSKASHPHLILENSGLVHDYISYPIGMRDFRQYFKLRQKIRKISPDILIYLAEPRGRSKIIRDVLFFKACGIKKLIGVPYTKKKIKNIFLSSESCYEHEAARLARCLSILGDPQLEELGCWNLQLTTTEECRIKRLLQKVGLNQKIIACSVGAKVNVKNWGITNWKNLFTKLHGL